MSIALKGSIRPLPCWQTSGRVLAISTSLPGGSLTNREPYVKLRRGLFRSPVPLPAAPQPARSLFQRPALPASQTCFAESGDFLQDPVHFFLEGLKLARSRSSWSSGSSGRTIRSFAAGLAAVSGS